MTDHDVLDDLALDLDAAASRFDPGAGDLAAVVARGRVRRRRRRGGFALLTAVALVAGGSLALDRGGDEETEVRLADSALRGDVPMSWRTVSPDSGLGFARDVGTAGVAPLYALSTAAGRADLGARHPSRVVWRSDDGVEWTAASTLSADLYLSDLATRGTRVYAVGTGAATAVAGGERLSPVVVGWSDDGAKTWERTGLDIDHAGIAAISASSTVTASDVAVSDGATLVIVVVSAELDARKVLPSGVRTPHGWAIGAEGVDVLAGAEATCPRGEVPRGEKPASGPTGQVHPMPCLVGEDFVGSVSPQEAFGVAASYTWEQLGISGDALAAVLRRPMAFLADGGGSAFERVELPVEERTYEVLAEAAEGGFDVAMSVAPPDQPERSVAMVLQSGDGRAWSRSSGRTGLEWVSALGRIDGRPAMIGQSAKGGLVVRSNGDGTWTSTNLTDVVDPNITRDSTAHVTAAAIGPLGAVVAVIVAPEGDQRSPDPRPRLLVTRDGATWSDTPVEELAGVPVRAVTRVLISGDRTLVTAGIGDQHRPAQLVLLGSPA